MSFPIYGLYPNYTNTIYISSLDLQGNSTAIETNKVFIGDIYQNFQEGQSFVESSKG